MENYDILIKNCQVLNPDMNVSSTCSVGIKDTWIKKIGSADEFVDSVATETLDGKGKLVMPGLIDGHTPVSYTHLDTLARICETLNCEITDVIELVPDEPASTGGKEHERIETKNNRKRN